MILILLHEHQPTQELREMSEKIQLYYNYIQSSSYVVLENQNKHYNINMSMGLYSIYLYVHRVLLSFKS